MKNSKVVEFLEGKRRFNEQVHLFVGFRGEGTLSWVKMSVLKLTRSQLLKAYQLDFEDECAQNAYDKSFYGREDASENDADEVANETETTLSENSGLVFSGESSMDSDQLSKAVRHEVRAENEAYMAEMTAEEKQELEDFIAPESDGENVESSDKENSYSFTEGSAATDEYDLECTLF